MELIVYGILLTVIVIAVAVCNAVVCRKALERPETVNDRLLRDFADRALSACDLSLDAKRVENERLPEESPPGDERFAIRTRHHVNNGDVIVPTPESPIN